MEVAVAGAVVALVVIVVVVVAAVVVIVVVGSYCNNSYNIHRRLVIRASWSSIHRVIVWSLVGEGLWVQVIVQRFVVVGGGSGIRHHPHCPPIMLL